MEAWLGRALLVVGDAYSWLGMVIVEEGRGGREVV